MKNDDEIIKKLHLVPIKITGKDLMKIIQEDGADSLADDLNKLKENINLKLYEMLGEARADQSRIEREAYKENFHKEKIYKSLVEANNLWKNRAVNTRADTAKEIFKEIDKILYRGGDWTNIGSDPFTQQNEYVALKKRMGIK